MKDIVNHPETASSAKLRSHLIESIYSTVAQPENWHTVISELADGSHSRSARLLIMNADATRVTSSIKINIDDYAHQQYVDHFVNTCPWRHEIENKQHGRFYSSYLHFTCPQPTFLRSEFFNDWAGPLDIHHGIAGNIYKDSDQTVQLLIQRTRGQGYFAEADVNFFNSFAPHLQHAIQLARQVTQRRTKAEALAFAAENEVLPFILLDHALRPIYCTPEAEALIEAESVFLLSREQLRLADPDLNRRLQRLLKKCLNAADSRTLQISEESLTICRPDGSQVHLWIKPAHPDVPIVLGKPAGYVAVYVHDPEAEVRVDRDRLKQLYNLSKAETRVVMAMLANPDPVEVAKRCFVSLHTVRSHLKAIFAKTGSRGQADLMKRLVAGPARQR